MIKALESEMSMFFDGFLNGICNYPDTGSMALPEFPSSSCFQQYHSVSFIKCPINSMACDHLNFFKKIKSLVV